MDHSVRKHKELLETKKRVNEFKLKQMKIISEQITQGDAEAQEEEDNAFDPRNNDAMIRTGMGMQTRYMAR